ncbi:MAG: STAS domain-containing protein [Phycisphaerales bacterium]
MTRQAYQIDRDRRVLVARPTRAECTGSDIAALVVELCQRIDTGEADSVVIDCSNVQLMDSCCLGRLLRLRQHTGAAGGSIALAGCRPNVAFLFEMTRLDKVLGLYETTAQAVDELRERRTRPKPQRPEPDVNAGGAHGRTGRYAPLLTALLRAHKRKHARTHDAHDPETAPPGSAA